MPHDPVVITGISGRYPECDSVEEFQQKLMSGVDLVTSDNGRRWTGDYAFKDRSGKMKDLGKFDAAFFGVHGRQATAMDPQLRILLEVTHEAIIDAGYNPQELKGTKTGVYVGCSQHETFHYWTSSTEETVGYAITGGSNSMFANRVSYSFDFKGPSLSLDTACSSCLFGLEMATNAIESGRCDYAIVAGVNVLLNPAVTLQFQYLSMMSSAGMSRSFDASGDGYVRAEGVVAVLLQRASSARRIYANMLGIKTNNDGYKVEGITFPSAAMQGALIKEVVREAGLDPHQVEYVEAHGTGTPAGDPEEMNAIAGAYCGGRKIPLLVGSVKSNMGHAEPTAALCGLTKIILAWESGVIPANLYYQNPNPKIPALFDGTVKVVTTNQKWNCGISAISSFGFGGANAHALVAANAKLKKPPQATKTPRLLTVSGRTQESVNHFFAKINEHDFDAELHALVHRIHKLNIPEHNYRGYQLAGRLVASEVDRVAHGKRPIWFVFTGMGCQWLGMGRDLLKLDPLRESLERSAAILKPHGVDLLDILTSDNINSLDNIQKAFVAITATQVALVDLLKTLGIEPDGIFGHSVGEIGCAYADNTLTQEQAVLLSYMRGRAINETKLPSGLMASIGLSWEQFQARAPSDIYAACNNSKDNITITGPPESIKTFLAELTKENIFARSVDVFGHAFHSKYIHAAGEHMHRAAAALIPHAKPRSKRWISSSVLENNWDKELAKTSSADYHVNNLLSPVYFYEASKHVPENAIVLEMAPHGLLQAVLRRSLPKGVTNIGLLKRNHEDNVEFLLSNIGRLYVAGANPNIATLYPPVQFPVSRGTPMLNSMVKWDHSDDWQVPNFTQKGFVSGESIVEIDLSKREHEYLRGHAIDGRILFPATGYLTIVWQSFAKMNNHKHTKFPVMFKNVKFLRATILPDEGPIRFLICIFQGSGVFQISENGSPVATGEIYHMENPASAFLNAKTSPSAESTDLPLNTTDVYKELHLRGYNYTGEFQVITRADTIGTSGALKWEDNWVTFMDAMLQFSILSNRSRRLCVPSGILQLAIDPTLNARQEMGISYDRHVNVVRCGGVEIRGLKASPAPRKPHAGKPAKLEKYEFVPLVNETAQCLENALVIVSQLLFENFMDVKKFNVAGVAEEEEVLLKLREIIEEEPQYYTDCTLVKSKTTPDAGNSDLQVKYFEDVPESNVHLFVINQPSKNALQYASSALKEGGFMLFNAMENFDYRLIDSYNLKVIYQQTTMVLVRKITAKAQHNAPVIKITNQNYDWVEAIKKNNASNAKMYLVTEGAECTGLIGLLKCLAHEKNGTNIRAFYITNTTHKFSLNSSFYRQQIEKDLAQNVLIGDTWGTFRHLPLSKSLEKRMTRHAYVENLSAGDLSSFEWIESELSVAKTAPCDVYYAALNFRDIMLATGKLPPETLSVFSNERNHILGFEVAGIKSDGTKVMGIVSHQGIATGVHTESLFWDVPKNWTLEEAVTVPVVYSTSYYALIMKGGMKRGESVLIHAGAGGVGISAISIALAMGCEVFTTVGSQRKRDFLRKTFPELRDDHIGNSRDSTFEQMIQHQTRGRGVDLVLNSLAGDLLLASLRCLAVDGRFLEIGKADLKADSPIGLEVFLKNTAYHGVIVDNLFGQEGAVVKQMKDLVREGIAKGEVRPLPREVFTETQVEDAFRFMASAKHIGKVVLKIRDEFTAQGVEKNVLAVAMCYFDPEKVYVIVGGLGGFGLELANWLVSRGARKIVLSSRGGIKNGYQSFCMRRWKNENINVTICTEDVTTETGAKNLLVQSNALGVVDAIFNLAVVLKDALMINQTPERFKTASKPKVDATEYLDAQSRILTPALRYFVVFSSVISGRGNAGQTNYAYANSAMERICERRRKAGLPALAIQWGGVGDVGLVAEHMTITEVGGTAMQSINSCLATLNQLLLQPNVVVGSRVLANKGNKTTSAKEMKLTGTIANILGVKNASEVPRTTTLADLGMDSLMSAEIKQTLERNYDLVLSPNEIRNLTFGNLAQFENAKGATITDDLLPKSICVKLPSKKDTGLPVFLIHHLRGTIAGLTDIAKSLEAPVYGIQCAPSAPAESMKKLALYYLDAIRDIQKNGPFRIIGYSFGTGVALEMGVELERKNEKYRMVFIDGTPEYLKLVQKLGFARRVTNRNPHDDDIAIAANFAYDILKVSTEIENKIPKELQPLKTWEAKVKKFTEMMTATVSHPPEDIKCAIELYQKRIHAIDVFVPSGVLSTEVLLIKATQRLVDVQKNYGMNEICRKFKMEEVAGDHESMLANPKICEVIKNFIF